MSRKQSKECSVPGCSIKPRSRDMCSAHYLRFLKDADLSGKTCDHCGVNLDLVGRGHTSRKYCEDCSPSGDGAANALLGHYDLSRPEYNAMYFEQDGQCAMAGCSTEAKEVDHWHGCTEDHRGKRACLRCVRALLCHNCNNRLEPVEDELFVQACREYLADFNGASFGGMKG